MLLPPTDLPKTYIEKTPPKVIIRTADNSKPYCAKNPVSCYLADPVLPFTPTNLATTSGTSVSASGVSNSYSIFYNIPVIPNFQFVEFTETFTKFNTENPYYIKAGIASIATNKINN